VTVNEIRRAKIDAYVTVLLQLYREIAKIRKEEGQDYLDRTRGSQATAKGRTSEDAALDLMSATGSLEKAIEALDKAVGTGQA
jgi:molecular chaperone GrpE (heat shock protein)